MASSIVKETIEYHLIIFQHGNETIADVIPVHWYDVKKKTCFWPKDSENVTALVKAGHEVESSTHPSTWNICKVIQILSPNIRKFLVTYSFLS